MPVSLGTSMEYSCTGKRNYSRRGAKRAAEQSQSRGGRAMEHYRCSHCGWYHIGHRPKAQGR